MNNSRTQQPIVATIPHYCNYF